MNKRSAVSMKATWARKRLINYAVLLACLLALLLVVGGAFAAATIQMGYGECNGTAAYLGYYSNHVRSYWQRLHFGGGAVADIQLYISAEYGDVPGLDWTIYDDASGFPVDPSVMSGYSELVGVFPAWVGTYGLGYLPAGWYWIQWEADVSVNGNYLGIVLSTSDCVENASMFREYDGVAEATSVVEVRSRSNEDFVVPTATLISGGGTPMPTLTPTITLTPTPILSIITTLESGAGVAIERTSTYGDRAIVIAICVLIVIMLVDVTTRIIYAKRNN